MFAQNNITVTVKGKNISIVQAFEQIESQIDYTIAYNQTKLDTNRKITVSLEKQPLDEAMRSILSGTGFVHKVEGRHIAITERANNPAATPGKRDNSKREIRGTVLDSKGDPVVGATVLLDGPSPTGTTSDLSGRFSLTAATGDKIRVSFLGYITVTLPVGTSDEMQVILQEDSQSVDEVVVVGFGTQKKTSVVGSVASIKPSELRTSSSSLINALAGRIAGVISVQRSGEPGADGANFWIRGISTFNSASASPLIFIDGVEVSTAELNGLSPEVIENFSVLKDATATALYGARGANGVMLVTTRQGSDSERAVVNVRVENSFTAPIKTVALADGISYMRGYNEAILSRNPNGTPRFDEETKILPTLRGENPLLYPNVDWNKELFKDFATTQSVNLNVSGGGKRVTYFLNATFNNEGGMLKKDKRNNFDNSITHRRISLQGNIAASITPTTRAILRINSQISQLDGSNYGTAELYRGIFKAPQVLFQPTYPTDGAEHIRFGNASGGPINWGGNANIYRNPYSEMVSGYREQNQSSVNASLELEQDLKMLLPGLKVKGLISFKNVSATNVVRSSSPFFYELTDFTVNPDGSADYDLTLLSRGRTALTTSTGTWGDRLFNLQVQAEYNQTFDRHRVSAMFVYMQRGYNVNNPGNNFYNTLPVRNQGLAGRLTYNYDDRYLFETNFGYNGSENFAEGRRFGFFPSVALGYVISNESFFKPLSNVISNLKFRASYGLVGSSFTDPKFPYLTYVNLENSGRGFVFGNDWQNYMTGISIDKIGTPNAHWEKGYKFNGGVDIGFFRNSLTLSFDAFREIRSDIFMQRRIIPVESGISAGMNPWANIGKVKNHGFELTGEYNKAVNKDLFISVRANVSYAENMLLNRDEPRLSYAYLSELNRPLNRYTGLVALGLFKDQQDIDNSPEQTFSPRSLLRPGDIKYADLNGDNKIDEQDMKQIGDPTVPKLVYGFGASVRWKWLDFSFFFQGVGNTSLMMENIHPYTPDANVLLDFIARDHWSEANPNPAAKYPRLIHNQSPSFNNFQPSTYWLRDASFLRLKNVELGFTYKFLRAYVSGQNLLTFSPFKHWDPELGGGNGLTYPNLRMVTIGVQFTY